MVSGDNLSITQRMIKSIIGDIGLIVGGLLVLALLMISFMGFLYGLLLAGSGKDLLGGIILSIVCNTTMFIVYEVSKRYVLPKLLKWTEIWRLCS